ncbi:MAG TPA: Rrf2 family transcriptional regulator [Clostridiales bacterium]|nr:Rrf2 family transcriptional regulator [Clostridiales bacterium]
MKLSTKGRYGVKAMFDLALHGGDTPLSLKTIAERQDISEPYLEQLISTLRKAGLVKSVRGAQGGYLLARSPDQITVGSIIRSLEGSMAPTECVAEDEPVNCEKADYCVTRLIWEKIRKSIDHVIDSITLQDMIDDYKKVSSQDNMYYI